MKKVFVCILSILLIFGMVGCNYNDYKAAMNLYKSGNYMEAKEKFEQLGDYKDSTEMASSAYAKYKIESIKQAEIGDTVLFGTYEQDNDTANGKEEIEWLVLDEKDGKKLLISKYVLDYQQYHTKFTDVTWENCTLRTWLNEDFLNAAFTNVEKEIIPTVTVSTDDNPDYFTNSSSETQDKVFLLSILEAEKYFSSSDTRQCKPTLYVEAKRTDIGYSGEFISWWLRTSGYRQSYETIIGYVGNLQLLGIGVNNNNGVRPVLWTDPESETST